MARRSSQRRGIVGLFTPTTAQNAENKRSWASLLPRILPFSGLRNTPIVSGLVEMIQDLCSPSKSTAGGSNPLDWTNRRLATEPLEQRQLLSVTYYVDDSFIANAGDNVTWLAGTDSQVLNLEYGERAFDSIDGAIAKAADGDTIKVAVGGYTEALGFNKELTVLGGFEGASAVTSAGVPITADHVTLDGFTLNINGITVGTVQDSATGVAITGNVITVGGGVGIQTGQSANVTGLLIQGNTLTGGATGIQIQPTASSNIVIHNNAVTSADFGIQIESNGVTVTGNSVSATAGTTGIALLDNLGGRVYRDVVIGAAGGEGNASGRGNGNTITGFAEGIVVADETGSFDVASQLSASIANNSVTTLAGGTGISAEDGVTFLTVSGNYVTGGALGMRFTRSTGQISGNTFDNTGDGLIVEAGVLTISGNTFINNTTGTGLTINEAATEFTDAFVSGNNFFNNARGLNINDGQVDVDNNQFGGSTGSGNNLVKYPGNSEYGLRIGGESLVDVTGNLFGHAGAVGNGIALLVDSSNLIQLDIFNNNRFNNNVIHVADPHSKLIIEDVYNTSTFDESAYTPGGRNIWGSIQPAIDEASAGGTVRVGAGVYDEQLSITKALTLTGGVKGGTSTVRPSAAVQAGEYDVEIDASNVTVQNFTFDFNAGGNNVDGGRPGTGIVVSDAFADPATNVKILNNVIYTGDGSGAGNVIGSGTGIQTGLDADVSGLLIKGNTFYGDKTGMGEGVYVNPGPGTNIVIENNTIKGKLYSGVSVEASNVTVKNNTIENTVDTGVYGIRMIDWGVPAERPGGINGQTLDNVLIESNTIKNVNRGISVGMSFAYAGDPSQLTATIKKNTVMNSGTGLLYRNGAAIPEANVTENTFTNNTAQILDGTGAYGLNLDTLYGANKFDRAAYTATGDGIYKSIETVVLAANAGDTVEVQGGSTYFEDGIVIDKNLTLRRNPNSPEGSGKVVLDGTNAGFDVYGLTIHSGADLDLEQFVVQNWFSGGIRAGLLSSPHTTDISMVTLAGVTVNGGLFGITIDDQAEVDLDGRWNSTGDNNQATTPNVVQNAGIYGISIQNGKLSADGADLNHNAAAAIYVQQGEVTEIERSFITDNGSAMIVLNTTKVYVHDSDLSDNVNTITNASGVLIQADFNWWGTTVEADVASMSVGNVDFTPYLGSGDTSGSKAGFQATYGTLYVSALKGQAVDSNRIQQAVAVSANVWVGPGSYDVSSGGITVAKGGTNLRSTAGRGATIINLGDEKIYTAQEDFDLGEPGKGFTINGGTNSRMIEYNKAKNGKIVDSVLNTTANTTAVYVNGRNNEGSSFHIDDTLITGPTSNGNPIGDTIGVHFAGTFKGDSGNSTFDNGNEFRNLVTGILVGGNSYKVRVAGTDFVNNGVGIKVDSTTGDPAAKIVNNSYSGSGTGVEVVDGKVEINESNSITGIGTGVKLSASGAKVTISDSNISDNHIGVQVTAGNLTIKNGSQLDDNDVGADLTGGETIVTGNTLIANGVTGVHVHGSAKAWINNSTITNNTVAGINVSGGQAAVEFTDLRFNKIGALIQGSGRVDLGQPDIIPGMEGLLTQEDIAEMTKTVGSGNNAHEVPVISAGGNNFSSYVANADGNSGAIVNLRVDGVAGPQGPGQDIPAFKNSFFSANPASIENVVFHDTDQVALGFVDYYGTLQSVFFSVVTPGPYTEGDTILIQGSFINPIEQAHKVFVAWGFDGDGNPLPGSGFLPGDIAAGTTTFGATHTYANDTNGQTSIVVVVTDGSFDARAFQVPITVANDVPVITNMEFSDGTTWKSAQEGQRQVVQLRGQWEDAGYDQAALAGDTWTVEVNWGDGTKTTETRNHPNMGNSFIHAYLDDFGPGQANTNPITVTVKDDDSQVVDTTVSMTVLNEAPTLIDNLSVTASANEGESVTLSGVISDPGIGNFPVQYVSQAQADLRDTFMIDVDWGDGSIQSMPIAWKFGNNPGNLDNNGNFTVTHVYADNRTDPYTVRVLGLSDKDGAQDTQDQVSFPATVGGVTVANDIADIVLSSADPALSPGSLVSTSPLTYSVPEGTIVVLKGTIDDSSIADSYTLRVNWGDGSSQQTFSVDPGDKVFNIAHLYRDGDATHTLNLWVNDDETGQPSSPSETMTVQVNNVAPTTTGLYITSVDEWGVATLTGTIVEPGMDDDVTISVTWGDGKTSSETFSASRLAGNKSFQFEHRYEDDADTNPGDNTFQKFGVSVTSSNPGGGSSTANLQATVYNVAPVLTNVMTVGTNPTGWHTLDPHPNNSDPWPYKTHTPMNPATPDWSFLNPAESGYQSMIGDRANVNWPYPAATDPRVPLADINEGDEFYVLAQINDPARRAETYTVQVWWGDEVGNEGPQVYRTDANPGNFHYQYETIINPQSKLDDQRVLTGDVFVYFHAPHTYTGNPQSGNYPIKIVVTDDDAASDEANTGIDVNNVAPQFTNVNVSPVINEMQLATLTGTVLLTGLDDVLTLTVDWADGSALEIHTLQPSERDFTLTHLYTDDTPVGTPQDDFVITLTVADNESFGSSTTTTVTVKDVAPNVTVNGPYDKPRSGWGNDPASAHDFDGQGSLINLGTTLYFDSSDSDVSPGDTVDPASRRWEVVRTYNAYDVYDSAGHKRWQKATEVFATGTGSGFSFQPKAYGDYEVIRYAKDEDGVEGSSSSQFFIKNSGAVTDVSAVTITRNKKATINEGDSIDLKVKVIDNGVDERFFFAIDWDGGGPGGFAAPVERDLSFSKVDNKLTAYVTFTHTYANDVNNAGTTIFPKVKLLDGFHDPNSDGKMDVVPNGTEPDKSDTKSSSGDHWVKVRNVRPTADIKSWVDSDSGAPFKPVITGDPPTTVNEGDTIRLTGAVTDPGADSHSYTWTLKLNGNNVTPANHTGQWWSFNAAEEGTYVVELVVHDGTADNDPAHHPIRWTIQSLNRIPEIVDVDVARQIEERDRITIDSISVHSADNDPYVVLVDWGDGTGTTSSATQSGDHEFVGVFSHRYLDDGQSGSPTEAYNLTLRIKEGNIVGDPVTIPITVTNVAPEFKPFTAASMQTQPSESHIGAQLVGEFWDGNSTYTGDPDFFGQFSPDTFTMQIDWGDGSMPDVEEFLAHERFFVANHMYADSGAFEINLTLTDDDTGVGFAKYDVIVKNEKPVVEAGPDQEVGQGDLLELAPATFTDFGVHDLHTATIDWGDNTSSQGVVDQVTRQVFGSHVYENTAVAPGYQVTVTVNDGDDSGSDSFGVIVTAAPPRINPMENQSVGEGELVMLGPATFTDRNDLGNHTAFITWGDGSNEQAVVDEENNTIESAAGHAYFDNGVREVTVTLLTPGMPDATGKFWINVMNTAPTIELAGDAEVDEGTQFLLTLGAITDPGDDTVTQYVVDWGDGNTETVFHAPDPNGEIQVHTYDDNGPGVRNISIWLIDEDGTHRDAGTHAVVVNNVAPTGFLLNGGPVNEGVSSVVFVAAPFDPSNMDTLTGFFYRYDFGADGTFETSWLHNQSSMDVPVEFLDDPGLDIIVEMKDKDGGVTSMSTLLEVVNVAPLVDAGDDADVSSDEQFLQPGMFADPGNDEWTVTVNYGDGGDDVVLTPNAAKSFELDHIYTTPGTYEVLVTVSDGDGSGTDEVMVTVEDNTFRVASFTQTPSGFEAQFNRAAMLSAVDLYDGGDASVDLPDVIVTDSLDNTLAGSITWDASSNTVSFVKSGGALEPGLYNVTLRSGAEGWQDADGDQLDGNGDRTAGDDYVTQFAVTQSIGTRTLSLPDFARGAGQEVDVPAGAGLVISVDGALGIMSVDLTVEYDPALLDIQDASVAPGIGGGWFLFKNFAEPGRLNLSLFGTIQALSGADVGLIKLDAVVPADAPYGESHVIKLTDVEINEGTIPAVGDYALHKAAYLGDVDASASYTAQDAALIAQTVVTDGGGFDAHRWTDPAIVGDTTGNSRLSGLDATRVFQQAMFLPVSTIPALPPGVVVIPAAEGIDPLLSIAENITATAGGQVAVPVMIDDLSGAISATFDVFYDSDVLTLASVEQENGTVLTSLAAGELTADWPVVMGTLPDGGMQGHARLGLYDPTSVTTGPGEIVILTFDVNETVALGTVSPITLGYVPTLGAPPEDTWNEGGLVWTVSSGSVEIPEVVTPDAEVVGRHVFYDGSAYDVVSDDGAIAVDKVALLPGETATFANYTSYVKGINGIMVDVADLADAGALSVDDFEFRMGNSNDPSSWAMAPAPTIVVEAGAGADGSDRIKLTWGEDAVKEQWLEVKVLATDNTGLAADDAFYFGNSIGETGNEADDAMVTSVDEIGARAHQVVFEPIGTDNVYDFDRNGQVTSTDQIIARNHIKIFSAPLLISVPDAGVASPASDELEAALDAMAADQADSEKSDATEALDAVLALYDL